MAADQEGSQDYSPAYEALVEFLYLAPVGIIKFRPDGTIEMANPTAAQLLMPLTSDGDLSNLYRLLSGLAPDLRSHVERFQEAAGQIFDQMQLVVPGKRVTLMLDINKINDETLMASLQNITDLTEARRQAVQETESQRMLASVFMRVNVPVVVVRADGFILMVNTALQTLLGYEAKSLVGLNIDVLLPADFTELVRAARAQQLHDGSTYEIETDVLTKKWRPATSVDEFRCPARGELQTVPCHYANLRRDGTPRPGRPEQGASQGGRRRGRSRRPAGKDHQSFTNPGCGWARRLAGDGFARREDGRKRDQEHALPW